MKGDYTKLKCQESCFVNDFYRRCKFIPMPYQQLVMPNLLNEYKTQNSTPQMKKLCNLNYVASKESVSCKRKCPIECNRDIYEIRANKLYESGKNELWGYVFYRSRLLERISEKLKYSVSEVVSLLGGNFGLLLGLSGIGILELLVILILIVMRKYRYYLYH